MYIYIYSYNDYDKAKEFLQKNGVKILKKNRPDLDIKVEKISEELCKELEKILEDKVIITENFIA